MEHTPGDLVSLYSVESVAEEDNARQLLNSLSLSGIRTLLFQEGIATVPDTLL